VVAVIKRFRLVRRSPDVAIEEFAARWTADQSALAGRIGAHHRLVLCAVRPGRTDRRFHGAAIEWFDDEEGLQAFDGDAAASGGDIVDVASTERVRVFDRTVFGDGLLADWWQNSAGAQRLLLLGIIQRRRDLTRTQFADYWWGQHRPLANAMLPPEVQPPIYVHNYALEGERCDWDGLGEFYDTSVDAARERSKWADTPDADLIVADEQRFLVRDTRYGLITDATVVVPGA
jgi:hypothetical protein